MTEESTSTSLTEQQAKQLGTIKIGVQRMKRERRKKPKAPNMVPSLTCVTEVSEKALKGKGIDTAIV